jgi:hypothetical protein
MLDRVFYFSVGRNSDIFEIKHPKFTKIGHSQYGWESETLGYLHLFCLTKPNAKVLYFHPKGSFHPSEKNNLMRKVLETFVINTHCIAALNEYDICGARFSIVPMPHYAGNFWWSKCSYINTLINPSKVYTNSSLLTAAISQKIPNWLSGRTRYLAEDWVGSGTQCNPADCMPPHIASNWIFNYDINITESDLSKKENIQCTKARMLQNPELFVYPYENSVAKDGLMISNLITRSYLWYGQPPDAYISWTALYRNTSKT